MNNNPAKAVASDDSDDAIVAPTGSPTKESEPSGAVMAAEEAKLMKEILTASELQRNRDLEPILKEVEEAKLAQPNVKIPPDVEDAGVVEPEAEAGKVLVSGSTMSFGVTEGTYEKGKKDKSWTSSLAGFALWITRLVKIAHKKTLKVVFRKGGN